MFFLKLILFLIVAGMLGYSISKNVKFENNKLISLPVSQILGSVAALFVLLFLMGVVEVIPAGHRGVVFNKLTGVENRKLGEGLNFITPLIEEVHLMEVRVDKSQHQAAAASSDIQDVQIEIVVNYNPDPSKVNILFQKFGENKEVIAQRIINPAVQEVVKASTAKFTAAEMIEKREELKQLILKGLEKRFKRAHLILYDVSIANITFNTEYTQAIEDKVRQEQIALKETAIVKQKEALAQQQIKSAQGDKEAAILRAQGRAEANRLLQQSLSPIVIQQQFLEKWDGKYPTYTGGSSGMLLQIPAPTQ